MGAAAAKMVASAIERACARRGTARVIFACAPSQNEFLATLVQEPVNWSAVTIFHMDEYVGLPMSDPGSFRHFLSEHLLARVGKPRAVHLIGGDSDPESECKRYASLLGEAPIDLVCLGIGENGHLAFNDPPVADFDDARLVKVVELDHACRQQQVNDGCFPSLEVVPPHAITLTIPALVSTGEVSCVVPGTRKASAVRDSLLGPIGTSCPASILRRHVNAVIHLDMDSAALLPT